MLSPRELHKFIESESDETLVCPQTVDDIVYEQAFRLSLVEDVYSIIIHISLEIDKSIQEYNLDTKMRTKNILLFIQRKD